ncbi:MAG: endonuclease/exonuclease/phosphatase family protein [Phycisphaerales bacterium]
MARSRWKKRLDRGAFLLALPLLAASGAWLAAPLGWRIDLVANLAAQTALVTIVGAGVFGALRAWSATGVTLLALGLHAAALAPGRAPRAGPAASPNVRVLVYNAFNANADPGRAIDSVLAANADLVVLVETPPAMVQASWEGGRLRAAYPYTIHRGWKPGLANDHQALLSRWPLTRTDGRPLGAEVTTVISATAESPFGTIGVVAVHPASPRNAERWRRGLEESRLAAEAARAFAARGLPVIVPGDLNSTPSGLFSRRLRSGGGLRRAKPWGVAQGTFPVGQPWPGRIAIDDVMVSAGVSVASWRTLDPAGSDHTPVLVELVVAPRSSPGG